MELIFEVLLELIFEGCLEGSTNKKVPLFIRILLATFIIATFAFVSLGLVFLGIILTDENLAGGLFIASIGVVLSIGASIKLKNTYFKKTKTK